MQRFLAKFTPSRLVWPAAVLLLAIFAWICIVVARDTSPTFDEPDHLATGYYSLTTPGRNDHTSINLRLTQIWTALPLLGMKLHFPTTQEEVTAHAHGVNFGALFVYEYGNDTEAMMRSSRAMITLLGVALGLSLFLWSRRLHGSAAGLVTLTFFCFSPLVISNSAVDTADIAAALFLMLSVAALWRLLHRVTVGTTLAAALAVAALVNTKISCVLLVPITAVLLAVRIASNQDCPRWVVRIFFGPVIALIAKLAGKRDLTIQPLWKRREEERPVKWTLLIGALTAVMLFAYLAIWAVYKFRYPMLETAMTDSWFTSPLAPPGFANSMITFCRAHQLLPEAYLYDLHLLAFNGNVRRSYLLGEYSIYGWWYFFPVVGFVKTPLPFLAALVLAATAVWQVWRRRLRGVVDFYNLTPLFLFGAIYTFFAMAGKLNIGVRHLLPLYMVLFVLAGLAVKVVLPGRRVGAVLVSTLLAWSAAEAAWVHPHYFAYFNELAGGSAKGHEIVVDSSYDWGEDLPAVRDWLAARAGGPNGKLPVYISYFGCADLLHYKINAVQLPSFYDFRPLQPYPLGPGTYIISATMLHSLYTTAMGPWRTSYEQAYQDLTKDMGRLEEALANQTVPVLLAREGEQNWGKKLRLYDDLRFARLCAHLRQRKPDARITYGMLAYDVSLAELQQALSGPPGELRQNYFVKGTEPFSQDELDFLK